MAASLLLAILGTVAFGSHVVDGGFYWDDWENAASARYAPAEGFALGGLELKLFAYRPVHALAHWIPHELLGADPSAHLALAIAFAVLASLALYALLRTLSLEPLAAGAIAALVLLFPWSDSTRLWATASVNSLAIAAYALGTVLALRGLETAGRRRRPLTAGAVLLYVVSVLTYEVTAAPILLAVLLYCTRVPWREALRRWRIDVAAVAGALVVVGLSTTRGMQSPLGQLEHALEIGRGAVALVALAASPFGTLPVPAFLGAAAIIVATAALLAKRLAKADPARRELRRWLVVAAAALVATAAGYAAFVPGEARYDPLGPGVGNRINIFAAIGIVLLVFALLRLVAEIVARVVPRSRRVASAAVAAGCVAIAIGYVAQLEADKSAWASAAAQQERILADLPSELGDRSAGHRVYSTGHELYAAPGIPIFATTYDLDGAVKLTLEESTVSAFPTHPDGGVRCGPALVRPFDPAGRRSAPARYGRALLLDVASGHSTSIDSRADCRAVADLLHVDALAASR